MAAKAADSLYDRLGVGKDASDVEIKKAYRMLALNNHPDKGGDPEAFKLIAEAYAILSDPENKRIYDATGVPRRRTTPLARDAPIQRACASQARPTWRTSTWTSSSLPA